MHSGFEIVAHADWGSKPDKRRMALARLGQDSTYTLEWIEPVREPSLLLSQLQQEARAGKPVLLGFDFPIGLPTAYANAAGISRFLDVLPHLGQGEWGEFYHPAETPDQICLQRPFYPLKPGGTSYAHLLRALKVDSMNRLRRRCELVYPGRRAAAPLFWTLGGQQVGKAAISGWRDVLAPAMGELDGLLFLWPFSGTLSEGLKSGKIIAAECYPGEYYLALGIRWGKRRQGTRSGKRSQEDRRANAGAIEEACERARLRLPQEVLAEVRDGFGRHVWGEDAFDALVGLLGILYVLSGLLPDGFPPGEDIKQVEGWILGQKWV